MAARRPLIPLLLLGLLAAQIGFARSVRHIPVEVLLVPEPPGPAGLAAQAFGDDEFLFRARALQLQHAGNLDGRILPLAALDYAKLAAWFALFDRLDPVAEVVPTAAAFLYSGTQRPADTHYLIDYLERHALHDPARKWRWLAQAVQMARYRLGDIERARALARELRLLPYSGIPYWARELEVFILTDLGEKAASRAILEAVLATDPNLPDNERRWIEYYVQRHLR